MSVYEKKSQDLVRKVSLVDLMRSHEMRHLERKQNEIRAVNLKDEWAETRVKEKDQVRYDERYELSLLAMKYFSLQISKYPILTNPRQSVYKYLYITYINVINIFLENVTLI